MILNSDVISFLICPGVGEQTVAAVVRRSPPFFANAINDVTDHVVIVITSVLVPLLITTVSQIYVVINLGRHYL